MQDEQKTKAKLLQELKELHSRVAELEQAAEEWAKIFDATSDLVFIQDKDFRFVKVNKSGCDLLKVKPEDLIGEKCYEVLHKSDKPWPNCPLVKALKDKRSHTEEVYDPNIGIPLLITTSPLFDENGELTSVVHITKDITDRKRMEEALGAERQRLYSLLDELPVFVYLQAPDYSVRFANRYFREQFGDPEGKRCYEVLWGAKEPCKPCPTFHVFETKKPQIWEWSQAPDGRIYEINDYPFSDVDGSFLVLELGIDITERKKAEEKLKREKERAEQYLNTAEVGMATVNSDENISMINKKACEILGYKKEELIGKNWFDILAPQRIRSEIRGIFRKLMAGDIKPVEYCENPLLTKDGDERLIAFHNALIRDHDGKIIGTLSSAEDITERKRAEEAVRDSESKYRTLVENLPQKIFLKDKNSVYVSCNDNLARDLKIRSEEIAGKTDYDLAPKELAEKYRADDKSIIESGETKDIEERYIEQGRERIIHTVKTPVKDEQGNVIGVLGIFWDITELKQAQEKLSKYRDKMARAEQLVSVGTLSASLTHELTQPLTVARLSIESVLAKPQAKPIPETIEKKLMDCLSGISEASSIIERFRDYARGMSRTVVNEISLKPIAERIVKLLKGNATRAKVNVSVKNLGRLPYIHLSERDTEVLFFVLIDNAIQAADGKKEHRLTISGAVKDGHIELQFADDCGGIAPERLDKIFELFFTTKPTNKGTGLGLCIVKQIVSRVGGKVHVKSKLGKGSTFFVTLPIKMGGKLLREGQ